MRRLTSFLLVGGIVALWPIYAPAADFTFQFSGCDGDTICIQPVLGGIPDSVRWSYRGQLIAAVDYGPSFDTCFPWNGTGWGRDSIVMHAWYEQAFTPIDSVKAHSVLVEYMTAMADGVTCFENDSVLIEVLANDTTSTPNATTVNAPVQGNNSDHGVIRIANEQIWYVPDPGYIGSDDFVYSATNDCGDYDTAVVAITVMAAEFKLIDSMWYELIFACCDTMNWISVGDSVRICAAVRPEAVGAMPDGFPKVYLPGLGENPGLMVRDTSMTLGLLDSTIFCWPGRTVDLTDTWHEVKAGNLDVAAGAYPIAVDVKSAVAPFLIYRDTIYFEEAVYTRVSLPEIVDVSDVPQDQGGLVSVRWRRSPFDVPGSSGVSEYTVWRATPWDGGKSGADQKPRVIGLSDPPIKSGARSISSALGGFAWEQVSSVTPHHFEHYAVTAPTLFDSTATGDGKHYFLVSAHSSDGALFWDSDPDSGHSVDNLAPPAPLLLAASTSGSGAALEWKSAPVPDVLNYKVYRDTIPGIVATPAKLVGSPHDTTFVDASVLPGTEYFYRVSGVDFAGNEGPLSNELSNGGCGCACHGEFDCNGAISVFEVVATIEVAFRGGTAPPDPSPTCPYFPLDVNCDNVISVFDVVRAVNVAFRGASVSTEYCSPCP